MTTGESISRLVVLAPNWLGDAVMALPAIRDIRQHFAGAVVAVAARPSVAPLFEYVPGIDEVVTLKADGIGRRAFRAGDVRALRDGRFDAAVLLPNSFRAAWVARRAGIAERWGYRTDFRRLLLTRSVRRPLRKMHFGAYYQHLAEALGMATGPLTPRIVVPRAGVEAAARMLTESGWLPGSPLVGLAPGAAFGHAKRWPPERFAALIALLAEQGGTTSVLLGRAADRQAGMEVEAALADSSEPRPYSPPRLINLIGRTDLATLMGVMAHCGTVIASDSGALHLAAAIGVPVIAIYGPTDERFSTPLSSTGDSRRMVSVLFEKVWCRPCGLRECPIDHRCMTRISPQRVLEAVRGQLHGAAAHA